jgi:methionine sulfoxide reductase catalytic subunit
LPAFYEHESRAGEAPPELARIFTSEPWSVVIDGECARRGRMTLEDVLKGKTLEEPTSKAAFVEFTTLLDPAQFPSQRRPVLDWPYVEGLRTDEAMHPLTSSPYQMYAGLDLRRND